MAEVMPWMREAAADFYAESLKLAGEMDVRDGRVDEPRVHAIMDRQESLAAIFARHAPAASPAQEAEGLRLRIALEKVMNLTKPGQAMDRERKERAYEIARAALEPAHG